MRWVAVIPRQTFKDAFYAMDLYDAHGVVGRHVTIPWAVVVREFHTDTASWQPVRREHGTRRGICREIRWDDRADGYALTCDDDENEVTRCPRCAEEIHESLWTDPGRTDHTVLIPGPVTVMSEVLTPDGKSLRTTTVAPHFLTTCAQIERPREV